MIKKWCELHFGLFLFLCAFFVPLQFFGLDWQFEITKLLFLDFTKLIINNGFENAFSTIDFSSDSISLLVLLAVLFCISIPFVIVFQKIKSFNSIRFIRTILVYYLAFILLKYGFDKIFKAQFYLPEPNILYSEFGSLSKDILYWSTIGTSRTYCIITGSVEVFTAILLLINRTRIAGLLLSIGVFMNVIFINFGFDISVKIFSILLLLMTLFAIYPNLKVLFNIFFLRKTDQISDNEFYSIKHKSIQNSIKFLVVGMMFALILSPYFLANNFNDDEQKRPFLHGAYQVISSNQANNQNKITRIFIHRKNYLILQTSSGKMIDYFFEIDQTKKEFKLTDYNSKTQTIFYNYSNNDSILELNFAKFKIISKSINWRKCAALQNDFHFTIDEIR